MIRQNEVFSIGTINKPHGIHGEMSFTFTTDIFDREDADFFIFEKEGILVPFFIESYRFKTDTTALLKLDGVDSEEEARLFNGATIFLPVSFQENLTEEDITLDFFTGFEAIDQQAGKLGQIIAVDESTENVLFIIDRNDDELLIPANDDFILNIDYEKRTILFNIPTGLLEI